MPDRKKKDKYGQAYCYMYFLKKCLLYCGVGSISVCLESFSTAPYGALMSLSSGAQIELQFISLWTLIRFQSATVLRRALPFDAPQESGQAGSSSWSYSLLPMEPLKKYKKRGYPSGKGYVLAHVREREGTGAGENHLPGNLQTKQTTCANKPWALTGGKRNDSVKENMRGMGKWENSACLITLWN